MGYFVVGAVNMAFYTFYMPRCVKTIFIVQNSLHFIFLLLNLIESNKHVSNIFYV